MDFKLISEYIFTIEKSKFIGLIYEVNEIDDVNSILDLLKKEHKKARHVCYGYLIEKNGQVFLKGNDDREPKGTASIPIINALQNNSEKRNIGLFIIRYFGGIKLGKGGLYRSYSKTALECLKLVKKDH